MKKFFLLIVLSSILINLNAQSTQEIIDEFLHSSDYINFRHNSSFKANGIINISKSEVVYERNLETNEINIPIIFIVFTSETDTIKIIGEIIAIKVKEEYQRLPNNSRYLLLYRDFRNFNFFNQSGQIAVFDLNYDEYLVGSALIQEGNLSSLETYPMPQLISDKYSVQKKIHPCDTNQNGDITFGECWRCFINACDTSPSCQFLCAMSGRRCFTSFVISCTWIAVAY